jgi:hypothetical protein
MINSVLNEGVKGMQSSAREMLKAANEITHFNVRNDDNTAVGSLTAEDQEILPVSESDAPASVGDIAEPLIELKRQELLFTASAKLVNSASETLGSILDIRS